MRKINEVNKYFLQMITTLRLIQMNIFIVRKIQYR